jgi:hypothetical protein
MTIKTTSRVATAGSRFQVPHNSSPFLLIMGAALLAVAFANRAGTMRKLAPVFGLAGILVILAGCGGGSNPPPPPVQTGTPAGTYNITMTANSSTGGTAVQTFTLTVQ